MFLLLRHAHGNIDSESSDPTVLGAKDTPCLVWKKFVMQVIATALSWTPHQNSAPAVDRTQTCQSRVATDHVSLEKSAERNLCMLVAVGITSLVASLLKDTTSSTENSSDLWARKVPLVLQIQDQILAAEHQAASRHCRSDS